MKAKLLLLVSILSFGDVWANDGDVFKAETIEGVELTLKVISEDDKTCQVGTGRWYDEYIDGGTITIPTSANGYTVIRIASGAFSWCNAYIVEIPSSVTHIEIQAFPSFYEPKRVILHEGLKSIGYSAFNCPLTSIEIPSTVTEIAENAFNYNVKLASVILKGEEPIDILKNVFNNTTYKVAKLYVPSSAKKKYENAAIWKEFWSINEGEPDDCNPSYIAVPCLPKKSVYVTKEGSAFSYKLSNLGKEPISSVSFYVSIDGIDEEEQTYTLPQPVPGAYNEYNYDTFEIPVTLSRTYSPGKYDMAITITKINGVDINYGADFMSRGCGKLVVFNPVAKHNVFIEEFTSTSCVWALRGKVGIKALEDLYGSRVIHMAVHIGDPMWCPPETYTPFTPTCTVNNRYRLLDPYYGSSESMPFGFIDDVEKYLNDPSPGSITILKATWADSERTAINVVMEVTFGVDDTKAPFSIRFNLLEDKMKGSESDWIQKNGYAGRDLDDPNLQPLTSLPSEISDMEYNHVAVQYLWYWGEIAPGKSPYRADTPQQVTCTIELNKNGIIQNKDNLSVVAFLYDNTYGSSTDEWSGEIFDADKMKVSDDEETRVSSVSQQPASADVYDLRGFKVSSGRTSLKSLPHGIYIVGGKKVVN